MQILWDGLELICPRCDFKTVYGKAFQMHIKTHEKNKCDICDYESSDRRNVNRHQRIVHSGKHKCTLCKKYFNSSSVLNSHMSKAHVVLEKFKREEPIYNCDKCNHKTKNKYNLRRHQARHSKPEKPAKICNICNQQFVKLSGLKKHTERNTCRYKDQIIITM